MTAGTTNLLLLADVNTEKDVLFIWAFCHLSKEVEENLTYCFSVEPFEFQHSLLGECSYHYCIHRINSPDLRLVRLHLAFSPDLKLSAAKRMTRYGPSNFILVRGLKK